MSAPRGSDALTDSLLAQTVPSWEACFYDGGSDRQESLDALKAEARIVAPADVDDGVARVVLERVLGEAL